MKNLFGRQEIADYVKQKYGYGSLSYVSAMIKGGLKVNRGNSCTTDDVDEFFRINPDFTFNSVYVKKDFRPKKESVVRSI